MTNTVELTPAQRRLYLQHRLHPDDGSLNLAFAYRLQGHVDVARLWGVLELLLSNSPALGTTFAEQDGRPFARVQAQPGGVRVRTAPVSADADEEAAAVVRELGARADRPMPLADGPLVEAEVITGRATYLTLLCSHMIGDAYTFYAFIDMVNRLYDDPSRWPEIRADLQLHPAAVVPAQRDSAAAEQALAALLADTSALTSEALAQDRSVGGAMPGTRSSCLLSPELADRLRTSPLVERYGLFSVVLSMHAVVLGALTGRTDVVVGVPLANRHRQESRRSLGYFVNTLPLPLDLRACESFDQLCATAVAGVRTLQRCQHVDLAESASAVLPAHHRGPAAVDNAVTFYKQQLALQIPGCTVEPLDVPRSSVAYPLATTLEARADGYRLVVEHAASLAAADPLRCLQHVLQTVLDRPDQPLTALGVVDDATAGALDRAVNAGRSYPTPPSLDAALHETARRHPHRPALTDEQGTLTYAELDALVSRAAATIASVCPGEYVGVALGRRRELVLALLGVLRAGKAYVPLDPHAPAERAAHILAPFDDLPLIADEGLLPASGPRLDPTDLLTGAAPPLAPDLRDRRADPAYVIFTSGSTGRPKGVVVTHGNVLRLLAAADEHVGAGPDDTWCLFHSCAFDFSVWELFGALLSGGRLVVVDEQAVRSPEGFLNLLVEQQVTVLNQTPSAFRRLLSVLDPRRAQALAVRCVVFGGEALHPATLRPWFELVGPRPRMLNMYGITETTVHVTVHEVAPADSGTETASVIGRPLGDLSVTVVDEHLNRVPFGVPGEILVGGPGVAAGYLGRPDLTAERFLAGTPYGEVVYRTGDRALVRPGGDLVYLGRLDRQVQLRGYRIELAEVEGALRTLPGVRDCVVRLDEPDGGEPRLVAWLVGPVADDADVRSGLRRLIPAHMVPTLFVRIPELPVTVNGKLDEAALRLPERRPATRARLDDELAERVAGIWTQVLQIDAVGLDDGFFDVGGTSMHVTAVHARLVRELQADDLALVELFEHATPRALAARLRRTAPDTVPLPRTARSRGGRRSTAALLPSLPEGA